MNELQALILGLLQGLTEFLPVSSSGHLELGHAILNIHSSNNLLFAVIVHLATIMSTFFVFRNDILQLIKGLFEFKRNDSTIYISKLLLSTLPVLIIGVCFENQIEQLFTSNLLLVGSMLIITAGLLIFAHYAKKGSGEVTYAKSLWIGLAQAFAVMPGISRSGATIATGLLLKTDKNEITRFSFLMVIIPILGAAFLDLIKTDFSSELTIGFLPLSIGFIAAFLSGLLACSWMVNIVKRGKLIYFAIYCFIIGLIAIFAA